MITIIDDLDGRVQWFWPEIVKQWVRESSAPVSLVREGVHLRLTGQWGTLDSKTGKRLIGGIDMGTFATAEMTEEAMDRIRSLITSTSFRESSPKPGQS